MELEAAFSAMTTESLRQWLPSRRHNQHNVEDSPALSDANFLDLLMFMLCS